MVNLNKAGAKITKYEYVTLQEFNVFYSYEENLIRNLNDLLIR